MLTALIGDITTLSVDAIVNAANETLHAGGGVCGAIHRAAGPELERECLTLGSCPTGQACVTKAYHLPCKWVVHAVGPRWQGGHKNEAVLLAAAYRASLACARKVRARTIAFPAISTGIFGYPLDQATAIAIATVRDDLKQSGEFDMVTFCCFDSATFELYDQHLGRTPSPKRVV
jgi:O-acetyl-ADP-ribose deacetylase (regulator of RNase III)